MSQTSSKNHISTSQLNPFISNMHTALWCLAGVSVLGAFVAAARPAHKTAPAVAEPQREPQVATP